MEEHVEILTGYFLSRQVAGPFMRGCGIAAQSNVLTLVDEKGSRKLQELINKSYRTGKIKEGVK